MYVVDCGDIHGQHWGNWWGDSDDHHDNEFVKNGACDCYYHIEVQKGVHNAHNDLGSCHSRGHCDAVVGVVDSDAGVVVVGVDDDGVVEGLGPVYLDEYGDHCQELLAKHRNNQSASHARGVGREERGGMTGGDVGGWSHGELVVDRIVDCIVVVGGMRGTHCLTHGAGDMTLDVACGDT